MEFLALHSELVRTLTSTVRRRELGASLSALVVPKPVTVASEPGCGKDVSGGGRQEKKLQKKGTTNWFQKLGKKDKRFLFQTLSQWSAKQIVMFREEEGGRKKLQKFGS